MSVVSRLLDLPLQWKLGLLVLAGLLLLSGLFGLLGILLTDESARRMATERLAVAQLTASFLDSEFEHEFDELGLVAARLGAARDDRAGRERLLQDLSLHMEPFVDGIFLTDQVGHVLWAEPPDLAAPDSGFAEHQHVREPLVTGRRYASGIHRMGSQGRPTTVFAVPVPSPEGKVTGVLGVSVNPRHAIFDQLVAAAHHLGNSGHGELVDQDLRLIASSDDGHVLGPAEHPSFYAPLLEQRISSVGLTDPIGAEDPEDWGQRHVMAFVPMTSVPWGVALGGSEDEFAALANRWRSQIAPLGGLAILIAALLIGVVARGVVRPVLALTQVSRRIAAGDLTTPVPRLGDGEVRLLAEAFDEMRRHLGHALEALAVEKSRYQGIVESMADAVFTTDARLRVTAFNPAAEMLTGWQAEEVLGRPCCQIVQPVDGLGLAACASNCPVLLTPSTPMSTTKKESIRRRDGRLVPIATTRAPIRGHDGALRGVVHVMRDISAEEEVNRLKDEFLSTISHELRTPLGIIKGYATMLLMPDGPQDAATAQRCLRHITYASGELEELVDNLLDMSKIGAGVLTIDPEPVRLRPLARAVVGRARVRSRRHRLRVQMPANLPKVLADPRRLEQVLHNLVDNAIKYSPSGGQVTIAAESAGVEVRIRVSDEGIGVPQEDLGRLFARFQRGSSADARRIRGSGLGLAICKGIIEAHGGRIWVERRASDDPSGTTICFTLPAVAVPVGRGAPINGRTSKALILARHPSPGLKDPTEPGMVGNGICG